MSARVSHLRLGYGGRRSLRRDRRAEKGSVGVSGSHDRRRLLEGIRRTFTGRRLSNSPRCRSGPRRMPATPSGSSCTRLFIPSQICGSIVGGSTCRRATTRSRRSAVAARRQTRSSRRAGKPGRHVSCDVARPAIFGHDKRVDRVNRLDPSIDASDGELTEEPEQTGRGWFTTKGLNGVVVGYAIRSSRPRDRVVLSRRDAAIGHGRQRPLPTVR